MSSYSKATPGIWWGQLLHFASLLILLILTASVWAIIGKPYPFVFWTAVAFPVAHQIYVWLAWRLEFGAKSTSRLLGFNGYVVSFFILFGGRFASLFVLAWQDRGSLGLSVGIQGVTTTLCALLGLYAMYSVMRYFGIARAAGADHFEKRYRTMSLVKKGIFRFTDNGMYAYAFLLFWAIALGCNSKATLLVAAFSHVYIWVHFYATEKPDMDYLYGNSDD